MQDVPIPGGMATVRDPDDMTERHRRIIRAAAVAAAGALSSLDLSTLDPNKPETLDLSSMNIDEVDAGRMFRMQDATIVACLAAWTLDQPLPTMDTVQDLPGGLYDALAAVTKDTGAGEAVDFSPTPAPDPKAPTGPRNRSSGRVKAATVPVSPLLSVTGTGSTGTGA